MTWILDGAVVIMIVAFAAASYKKGFLNTITRFAGTIGALLVSIIFSAPAAEFIFSNYISQHVSSVVTKHLGNISQTDVTAFTQGMRELIDELPTVFSSMLQSAFGVHVEEWYQQVVASDASTVTDAVIECIISPLATGLLRVLAFFVIFGALMLLVNALAGLLTGVNFIPLIGSLNEILGGVLGGVQGMLYVFVVASALWLIISASGGSFGPITHEIVESTMLFKHFYNIGPWVETTAQLL